MGSQMHQPNTHAARSPADQADGLRRLFAAPRQRILPLVANAMVEQPGVLLERVSSALAALGANTLIVDAADTSPDAHEMASIDLSACIEPLGAKVNYLAARGLPLRHVNARGSAEAWLQAIETAAPRADVILLHASARDLVRMLGQRPVRPVLTVSLEGNSLTDAYTSMKLLAQRSGLLTFDLLVATRKSARHAQRIAERLAQTGDLFLSTVLRTYAAVDCSRPPDAPVDAALHRLATEQLLNDSAEVPVLAPVDAVARPLQATGELSAFLY
jgi:flagellar biosynthesis protein FlhG